MSKDKPDAWMPLYIGDWESGTRHLDCEQDGAYGRLIRHYWRNGPLPDDDGALARIVGMALPRWRKVRPVLVCFFTVQDGRWYQKRVDAELERWAAKRDKAIEKSKKAAGARWGRDATSNATSIPDEMLGALLEQCPSASSTEGRGSKKPLPLSGRRSPSSEPSGSPPPAWQGPTDIRELVVDKMGEDFAASWLDRCGWQDVPERLIVSPTGVGADRLWRAMRREFAEREISVGRKAAA